MNPAAAPGPTNAPRVLTLRSGGWVLVLALVLTGAVAVWRISAMVRTASRAAIGDGENVATYGFDLAACLIPRDQIVASGLPRDGLPALVNPPCAPLGEWKPDEKLAGTRKLLLSDRVVGVLIGDQARAYPLWLLAWHEVVNDTLDGQPILVTFSPLCDSVVVFDRTVAGQTLTFGFSGLVHNANLLFYDRENAAGPSLWSQLQFRAVSGPAAAEGRELRPLPAEVLRWEDWHTLHPQTTICLPDPQRKRLYKLDAYTSYYGSDELRFPTEPLPPPELMPRKTPVLALRGAERWLVVPLPSLAERVDSSGTGTVVLDGRPITVAYRPNPPTAWVRDAAGAPAPLAISSFWFAWYSQHAAESSLLP